MNNACMENTESQPAWSIQTRSVSQNARELLFCMDDHIVDFPLVSWAEFIGGYGGLSPPMSQDESKMLCENNKGYAIDA